MSGFDPIATETFSATVLGSLFVESLYSPSFSDEVTGTATLGGTVKYRVPNAVALATYDPDAVDPLGDILTRGGATVKTLEIDQYKAFNVEIDRIEAFLASLDIVTAEAREAVGAMNEDFDVYLAGIVVSQGQVLAGGAGVGGTYASPVSITSANAYAKVVDLQMALNDARAPFARRRLHVPGWFHGKLQLDARFVGYGTTANDERLKNGAVGFVAGFEVVSCPAGLAPRVTGGGADKDAIVGLHPDGGRRASAIEETRIIQSQRRFGWAIQGLHVYGAAVIRPSWYQHVVVTAGAEA
jgi:hypothetical protein